MAAITRKQSGDLSWSALLHQGRKLKVAAAHLRREKAQGLRKQGIPAKVEEIVIGANPVNP